MRQARDSSLQSDCGTISFSFGDDFDASHCFHSEVDMRCFFRRNVLRRHGRACNGIIEIVPGVKSLDGHVDWILRAFNHFLEPCWKQHFIGAEMDVPMTIFCRSQFSKPSSFLSQSSAFVQIAICYIVAGFLAV